MPKESTGTGKEINDLSFGMITINVSTGSLGDLLLEISDIAKNFSNVLCKIKRTQIFVSYDRGPVYSIAKADILCWNDFYWVNYNNFSTGWMAQWECEAEQAEPEK